MSEQEQQRNSGGEPGAAQDENKLIAERRGKLATLRAQFVVKERNKDGTLVPRELSRARIFVDLIVGQETRAIEYRVL